MEHLVRAEIEARKYLLGQQKKSQSNTEWQTEFAFSVHYLFNTKWMNQEAFLK